MAEIIATGKTVDEAVAEGCRQLNVSRDEVSVEVLEMPQKILFFSKPAKVRVTRKNDEFSVHDLLYGSEDEHRPGKKAEKKEQNNKKQNNNPKQKNKENKEGKQNQTVNEKKDEKKKNDKPVTKEEAPAKEQKKEQKAVKAEQKNSSKESKKKQKKVEKKEATVKIVDTEAEENDEDLAAEVILEMIPENELPERAVKALTFLKQIVDAYGAKKVEYTFARTERGVCIQIGGQDAPMLIGKRGELMDAIQYLCTVGSSRDGGDYCRVSLDIEGYRARREKALRGVAAKTAAKVLRVRRSQALEPMNPYERAIVHSEVQKIEGVSSHSVGSEPRRKVVITLEGEGGEDKRRGRRNRSGKSGSFAGKKTEQAPAVPKVRMSDIPVKKELKSTEEFIGSLYGKIEL